MVAPQVEPAIREFFASTRRDVVAVYLFGSQVRNTRHVNSDIDIAVLLAHDPPSTLSGLCLDLASDLERQLSREIDLIVLNKAPPDLVHRVLRDGRLLVDRDPAARIRFEVKVRNEYFDLHPTLQQDTRGEIPVNQKNRFSSRAIFASNSAMPGGEG